MKPFLISLFAIAAASIAHAGGGCCEAGGDKSDKKDGKTGFSEQSVIVAGSGCGSDKDCDKDAKSATAADPVRVAGCGGGKGCDDDKGGKSGHRADAFRVAGGDCGGDKGCDDAGKDCGYRRSSVFAA